jgi:hypothetical protein
MNSKNLYLENLPSDIYLKILLPISQELNRINNVYENANEANHSNQSNLLSVNHLRGIYTALEILWQWGILPFLPVNYSKESLPKSILMTSKLLSDITEKLNQKEKSAPSPSLVPLPALSTCIRINELIRIIFRTCTSSMFRGMMIERNYKRILCGCISILCHWNPQSLPTSDQGHHFPTLTPSSDSPILAGSHSLCLSLFHSCTPGDSS